MSRLASADEPTRRQAWEAIERGWQGQSEAAAAILNALAGWRLTLAERRSHTIPVDYLTQPLHSNRIERETLDAMFSAVEQSANVARAGNLARARMLGKPRLDPWDLMAPCPVGEGKDGIPFEKAVDLIAEVFHGVDPELSDFVRLMQKKNWLEGRVLPNKRQGAFSTKFAKSREPRVFMTYNGAMSEVKTLAHEIGHSYHTWLMRDMHRSECGYPMTLAETASIFAETALRDGLAAKAQTGAEKLAVGWQDADRAAGFILNIPARFDFEREFYEQRKKKRFTPEQLSDLMENSWRKWYGDSLTKMDRLFWASKLHFHFAQYRFYNFPYTFGFLFSLRIYSLHFELGPGFMPVYKAILRDTGRMTAEELIKKHLNEDIREVSFWRRSLQIVEKQISAFGQRVQSPQ
jgi:oligoendopeptidase F